MICNKAHKLLFAKDLLVGRWLRRPWMVEEQTQQLLEKEITAAEDREYTDGR